MTSNQAELFAYIQQRLNVSRVSPSYDEMAAHMDSTRSNIHRIVMALRDAGHIRMIPGRARSITIPDRASDVLPSVREAMHTIISTTSLAEAQKAAERVLKAVNGVAV